MTGGRIDGFRVPCRRAITAAIVRRAEMRAALDHLAWEQMNIWLVTPLSARIPSNDRPSSSIGTGTVGNAPGDRRGCVPLSSTLFLRHAGRLPAAKAVRLRTIELAADADDAPE
jgi:hypothetical protein